MLGTLTSFCLMAVSVRELSGEVDTFQVLFIRSVIGLIVISLVIVVSGKTKCFRINRLGLHGIRNSFHFAGQYGWFLGIGLLPLAEVFALEFTVPLWTALVAYFFLKEALTVQTIISILLGISGVIVIVQPGVEIINYASLVVLGAAICYAITHVSTKAISSTEHPFSIIFMMCLIQLPIGFLLSFVSWQYPTTIQWIWITIIGITALSAHYCMTKAMLYTEVTTVVTMDFFRLPVIAIIGVVLYSEELELSMLIGALFILFGNLLKVYSFKHGKK